MSGFASLLSAGLKVASLDLCADEYLLMFAPPGQIASVSFLAKDEAESPLAKRAAPYPTNDGSVESVIKVRPDILLTTRAVGGDRAAIARRLGMEVVVLPYAATPEAVAANVRKVARLAGSPEAADQWQSRYDAMTSAAVRQRQSVMWVGPGGLQIGDGAHSWLQHAGLKPVPLNPGLSPLEQLATTPADIMLVSTYRDGQYSRSREWMRHPIARRGKRIEVDGRAWTCAGPLMLGEIEKLRQR